MTLTDLIRPLAVITLACSLCACALSTPPPARPERLEQALRITHLRSSAPGLPKPPYPVMAYYRTEVQNVSTRPLRIVWFEAYSKSRNDWIASNALHRMLDRKIFTLWYTEGDTVVDGLIGPGQTAVIDVNWAGGNSSQFAPGKWAYLAVDDAGYDYYAEAIVEPDILRIEGSPKKVVLAPTRPPPNAAYRPPEAMLLHFYSVPPFGSVPGSTFLQHAAPVTDLR